MRKFEVFLEEAEEGGYVVTVPSLPGCVSEGETREEALANIKDAIEGYLATLRKHKGPGDVYSGPLSRYARTRKSSTFSASVVRGT